MSSIQENIYKKYPLNSEKIPSIKISKIIQLLTLSVYLETYP